jgi:CHAD domain-containing protein
LRTHKSPSRRRGQIGRHPTMNTRAPRTTTRLLQRLARSLKRHLPEAAAGNNIGVHQARVTSRRLREAVPVLATGLKGSKAGKATRKIRRLTRALGTVRELDVTLTLLEELAAAAEVSRTAVEDVRSHVVRERDARRAVMLKRLERVDADKLGRRLASVGAALESATEEPWRRTLCSRLLRRSKRLSVAMDAAGQMYSPERLHEVRIASKKLRYGLELAFDSGVKQAGAHVRTIKRAQDLLGKLHDLQVLQTHIAEAQINGDTARPEPRAALAVLAAHVEGQCRRLHGRYLSSSAALRDVPAAIRNVIVPQLAQPPRRRRPLKMALSRQAAPRAVRPDRGAVGARVSGGRGGR